MLLAIICVSCLQTKAFATKAKTSESIKSQNTEITVESHTTQLPANKQAQPSYLKGYEYTPVLKNKNNIDISSILETARTQRADGRYEESLGTLKLGLSIVNELPVEEVVKEFISLPLNISLCNTLMLVDRYEEANAAIVKAVHAIENKGIYELFKDDKAFIIGAVGAYYMAATIANQTDTNASIKYLDKGVQLLDQSKYKLEIDFEKMYEEYADLYVKRGQNKKALSIFSILAYKISTERKQSDSTNYARLLFKLADLYMVDGNNGFAELLMQGAVAIYSKHEDKHWYDSYWSQISLLKLQDKLLDAISIGEKIESRALSENNKGQVLRSFAMQLEFADRLGDNNKYTQILNRFNNLPKNIIIKNVAKENPEDFLILSNSIAQRFIIAGRFDEALSMLDIALGIALKELGKQHFLTIKTLLLLAKIDEQLDVDRSINMYGKLAAISYENGLLIQTIDSLSRLSYLQASSGNIKGAVENGMNHSRVYLEFLINTLPGLPRRDRINTVRLFNSDLIHTLSLSYPQAIKVGLWTAINERGLLNHIEISQRKQEHDKRQIHLRKRLGELSSLNAEKVSDKLTTNNTAIRNAELLYNQLSPYEAGRKLIDTNNFMSKLPSNSTYIHVVRFRKLDFSGNSAPKEHYGAYISSTADVLFIDIGDVDDIDRSVSQALISARENHGDAKQKLFGAYSQALKKILSLVDSGSKIFISLDSEMNTLPINSLYISEDGNKTISDKFDITLVSSPRDYVYNALNNINLRQDLPAILADPTYEHQISSTESGNAEPKLSSKHYWPPLRHAENEGKAVFEIIGGRLLTQNRASKESLLSLHSPKVLHIAAHAFFEPKSTNARDIHANVMSTNSYQLAEHYLLQSGIALAAPKGYSSGSSNAEILTAGEAAYLDLRNTELVVLSACSTGEGLATNGLGVFGLYRSFIEAGANSVLISLWKVDDESTSQFMAYFYRELKLSKSKTEALRNTQKAFREGLIADGKWADPYYWGAWQLVGDWRPINGL